MELIDTLLRMERYYDAGFMARGEQNGRYYGLEPGYYQGKREMDRKLIHMNHADGMPVEKIAEFLHMPVKEIMEIVGDNEPAEYY